jgi:hypothetical protein
VKLPWTRRRHEVPEEEPYHEDTVDLDRATLERDIGQIKRLNEFLLNRAVAQGRISEDTAAAIRATQSYEHEVLNFEHGRAET